MVKKYAIGIDLGGTNIRGALVDESGHILLRAAKLTPQSHSPDPVIDSMVEIVTELRTKSSQNVDSLGIGAPGPLNPISGIVSHMPNIEGFDNYPLADIMKSRTGCDVQLVNDADAAAMGEYHSGAAQGILYFALLTLGTGLGSSVMIRGRPWVGQDGFSPELGHLPLFESMDRCGCGHIGHVETVISSRGLWEKYRQLGGNSRQPELDNLSVRLLFDLSAQDDNIASAVITRYAETLGRVILSAAVMLNLKFFFINGGISSGWNEMKDSVNEIVRKYGFSPLTDDLVIRNGTLGDDAALIGAASVMTSSVSKSCVKRHTNEEWRI